MKILDSIQHHQQHIEKEFVAPPPRSFAPSEKDSSDDIDVSKPFLGEVIIGQRFGLCYRDVEGNETMRYVTISRLRVTSAEENCYVMTYCHLRRAPRTFRTHSILYIICPETGEIEDNAHTFLRNYGLSETEFGVSSLPTETYLLGTLTSELQFLAYLAACDGHFHDLEREAMLEYVMARLPHNKFNVSIIEGLLRRVQPDILTFNAALRRIKRMPVAERQLLFRYSKRLVNADGMLSEQEFEAILAIDGIYS